MPTYNPLFCPQCVRIRGLPEGKRQMLRIPHNIYWNSFEMCEDCYVFQREHPEKAKENIEKYEKKIKEKEEKERLAQSLNVFQVYFVDSKFSNVTFAEMSTSPYKFSKVSLSRNGYDNVKKLAVLVSQEKAEEIVEILKSKEINSWYEKIDEAK